MILWLLFGALVGYMAASTRGYNKVAGTIAGALLGIFSLLLFCVSGVVSKGDGGKKCPKCAEYIQNEASVCRYCRHTF